MALQLDDDDEMKFSAGASSYKENEGEGVHLLPAREREFREYLVDSKAVDEVVRLLVGLAETPGALPENPVANWRAMYDAERDTFQDKSHLLGGLAGPQMVSGRAAQDIPALLDENDALRKREAELSTRLHEAVSQIESNDAAAAAVVLDGLLEGGAFASADVEGALDVGKLYSTISGRFPPPTEEADELAAPEGSVTMDGLKAWARATFGYGAPSLAGELDLPTLAQCADADAECEVDEEKAKGLYAACVALAGHAVPPPVEE